MADLIEDSSVLGPIIMDALQDKEWRVRGGAASAAAVLSELKHPRSSEILIGALNDPHPNVRASAARACADSKDPRTVMPLTVVLRKDPNSYVRWHAANALGELGDPRAIDPLTAAMKDQNEIVRMRSKDALKRVRFLSRLRE